MEAACAAARAPRYAAAAMPAHVGKLRTISAKRAKGEKLRTISGPRSRRAGCQRRVALQQPPLQNGSLSVHNSDLQVGGRELDCEPKGAEAEKAAPVPGCTATGALRPRMRIAPRACDALAASQVVTAAEQHEPATGHGSAGTLWCFGSRSCAMQPWRIWCRASHIILRTANAMELMSCT